MHVYRPQLLFSQLFPQIFPSFESFKQSYKVRLISNLMIRIIACQVNMTSEKIIE